MEFEEYEEKHPFGILINIPNPIALKEKHVAFNANKSEDGRHITVYQILRKWYKNPEAQAQGADNVLISRLETHRLLVCNVEDASAAPWLLLEIAQKNAEVALSKSVITE